MPIAEAMIDLCWDYTIQQLARLMKHIHTHKQTHGHTSTQIYTHPHRVKERTFIAVRLPPATSSPCSASLRPTCALVIGGRQVDGKHAGGVLGHTTTVRITACLVGMPLLDIHTCTYTDTDTRAHTHAHTDTQPFRILVIDLSDTALHVVLGVVKFRYQGPARFQV